MKWTAITTATGALAVVTGSAFAVGLFFVAFVLWLCAGIFFDLQAMMAPDSREQAEEEAELTTRERHAREHARARLRNPWDYRRW